MTSDSNPADQELPKIEFPCLYPIKVIGKSVSNFQEVVIATVEMHTGKITAELIKSQASRGNNYVSITLTIAATGEEQLLSIFQDLKKIEAVKMVL